ncbi:MAG: XdhC/CoxI family protein [Gemmatimonadota bacterium]
MIDTVTPTDAARAALSAAAGGQAAAIVAAIGRGGAVRRMIVRADGTSNGTLGGAPLDETALRLGRAALQGAGEPAVETVSLGNATWLLYVETHRPPEQLVIVGAGHIAVPLAHLGSMLGFRVVVLDDREEFATTDRFDEDILVRQSDFATDPFADVVLDEHSYVALVTRGHRWDFDCLQRLVALDARPRYIGMIGSRRRVRAAFRALLEAGMSRQVLAGIRAPIGLEIQAETPAEIAVAIAAELVAVRRGAEAGSISRRERVLDRFLNEE